MVNSCTQRSLQSGPQSLLASDAAVPPCRCRTLLATYLLNTRHSKHSTGARVRGARRKHELVQEVHGAAQPPSWVLHLQTPSSSRDTAPQHQIVAISHSTANCSNFAFSRRDSPCAPCSLPWPWFFRTNSPQSNEFSPAPALCRCLVSQQRHNTKTNNRTESE